MPVVESMSNWTHCVGDAVELRRVTVGYQAALTLSHPAELRIVRLVSFKQAPQSTRTTGSCSSKTVRRNGEPPGKDLLVNFDGELSEIFVERNVLILVSTSRFGQGVRYRDISPAPCMTCFMLLSRLREGATLRKDVRWIIRGVLEDRSIEGCEFLGVEKADVKGVSWERWTT